MSCLHFRLQLRRFPKPTSTVCLLPLPIRHSVASFYLLSTVSCWLCIYAFVNLVTACLYLSRCRAAHDFLLSLYRSLMHELIIIFISILSPVNSETTFFSSVFFLLTNELSREEYQDTSPNDLASLVSKLQLNTACRSSAMAGFFFVPASLFVLKKRKKAEG